MIMDVCSISKELFRIFRLRGTPTEDNWPGVMKLPNYNVEFPMWIENSMPAALTSDPRHPGLTEEGFSLLNSLFVYDPSNRLSCTLALEHPYFDEEQ